MDTSSSSSLRRRLEKFYSFYCPEKLKDKEAIEKIVIRFTKRPDKIDELFRKLKLKYKEESKKRKKMEKERKRAEADEERTRKKKEREENAVARSATKKTDVEEETTTTTTTISERQIVRLPSGVEVLDLEDGNGPEATRGELLTIRYKGNLVETSGTIGPQFDQGTLTFTLGRGQVIKGFDIGIVGVRTEGVRRILVPSKLGYGSRGAPPQIPPNADLLFEIKLIRIGSRRQMVREERNRERHEHDRRKRKRKSRNGRSDGGRRRRQRARGTSEKGVVEF